MSAINATKQPDTTAGGRQFGLVMAAAAGLLGLWAADGLRLAAWSAAGACLAAALLAPTRLARPARHWLAFGDRLHRLVSPLVLAAIYLTVIVPTGLLLSLFGKRPLALRIDRRAASYWIPRQPPGPPPESMKDQF